MSKKQEVVGQITQRWDWNTFWIRPVLLNATTRSRTQVLCSNTAV